MTKPKRREFIPELRDIICNQCPGKREETLAAIDSWRDGNKPSTPYENGVFCVCDWFAADMDSKR